MFSANLQETLGISWYEGALVGAIPMVPDRLSYSEMALPEFKYPSEWTQNFDNYREHKQQVCDIIVDYIENYEKYINLVNKQALKLKDEYFGASKLISTIKNR